VSGLVDYERTARRLRRSLALLSVTTFVLWLVGGVVRGGLTLRALIELSGVALLLALLVEFLVVGGAALGGALRAGGRGERLASADVRLVPPQLHGRLEALSRRRGPRAR
jgi:uncharacterized membrane protein